MRLYPICVVTLDPTTLQTCSEKACHERAIAISDMISEGKVALHQPEFPGPYSIMMSLQEQRLILHFSTLSKAEEHHFNTAKIALPLASLRHIIKDYFLICESYEEALLHPNPTRIEAIDMGRRGLHNEGSTLLQDLFSPKLSMEFDTARRLFTLICALHIK